MEVGSISWVGLHVILFFFFLSTLKVSKAFLSLLWCPSWTFLGSHFFFDRVNLAFHTFILLHCSCSLHS